MLTIRLVGGPYDGAEWKLDSSDLVAEIVFRSFKDFPTDYDKKPPVKVIRVKPDEIRYVQTNPPHHNFDTGDTLAIYEPSPPGVYWGDK